MSSDSKGLFKHSRYLTGFVLLTVGLVLTLRVYNGETWRDGSSIVKWASELELGHVIEQFLSTSTQSTKSSEDETSVAENTESSTEDSTTAETSETTESDTAPATEDTGTTESDTVHASENTETTESDTVTASEDTETETKPEPDEPCLESFNETFENESRFICTHNVCGFGNTMFAYASVYGMASAVNKTVVIGKDSPLLVHFEMDTSAVVVADTCICQSSKTKMVFEKRTCSFDETLLQLRDKLNYRPLTFLQSWMYFGHVVDDIRRHFTFRDFLREEATAFIEEQKRKFMETKSLSSGNEGMTSDSLTVIGVHVRRGDMVSDPNLIKFGFAVAPASYFQNAMAYYREKYGSTLFIICSDEIEWSKENIVGNDVVYVEGNTFELDLAILSHCDHSIMSVGTFGWWASFLANGETIYYKNPATEGSSYQRGFSNDFKDYFYSGWIGME